MIREWLQVVVNMLSSPLTGNPAPWIAFSFNPDAVRDARSRGLPVMFGDGSNINVMNAATGASPLTSPAVMRDFFWYFCMLSPENSPKKHELFDLKLRKCPITIVAIGRNSWVC